MPVTEGSRDRMHQRLKEVLGDEPATTLMEHLPPKGWDEVATKGDLNHLREWVDVKLDALRHELRADVAAVREQFGREIGSLRGEIGNLRGEMHATIRTHTLTIIGTTAAFNGLVVALLR